MMNMPSVTKSISWSAGMSSGASSVPWTGPAPGRVRSSGPMSSSCRSMLRAGPSLARPMDI
jgi:hypothetical protein